ncbi:alpha/beta fold hydrolase [Paenibacillus sp. GD4]|uniref:SGNH/GDSL hydrolase family protein n=1 Tax=Paenibacillus sp. GD4 TaxID=3068890 RepID=UPI002796C58F|nr:alpha/beta fold hydrolase [Paenibacillus sp. GD4]MDQ1912547.1 alpha/beta fold hydrolase [Paenibacillus sp. GD4]
MGTLFLRGGDLPQAKRIVFVGDSITDNGLYIAFMEAYFLQHMPERELTFVNLGVSSETVSGLSEKAHPWPRPCLHDRLERVLRESKPDWLVFLYGMNDGIYHPYSEDRFRAYQEGMLAAISKARPSVEKIIVLTPTPYDHSSRLRHLGPNINENDSPSWRFPDPSYNEVLSRYADWVLSLPVLGEADAAINIYDPLRRDLEHRRRREPEYMYGDGIHPNAHGHWSIAQTLLSRLFNITLERIPDYVNEPNTVPWFRKTIERHRLLSTAWKEHVGHSHVNKADAKPLPEALMLGERLRKEIAAAACFELEKNGLTQPMTTDWHGYTQYQFYLSGREALVVAPKQEAAGRPWVWRTEFFGAFATADLALLEQGWHIAYIRLSHLYGCPFAVRRMEDFRARVVDRFGLASKAALFGFSRGGLYAVNYAAVYPEHVMALYLDAPVLDHRSWPGGKGAGIGSPTHWEECLAVYGVSEEQAIPEESRPLASAGRLANAGIPVLLIAGDADTVVPYPENGELFERQYREAGGTITVIVKRGIGHHPHSLENPEPIVRFLNGAMQHGTKEGRNSHD